MHHLRHATSTTLRTSPPFSPEPHHHNFRSPQTLLTCVTFDEWATTMYATMRAETAYAWVYFVLIVALGGFYVVNLFLAVIFKEFVSTKMVRACRALCDVCIVCDASMRL